MEAISATQKFWILRDKPEPTSFCRTSMIGAKCLGNEIDYIPDTPIWKEKVTPPMTWELITWDRYEVRQVRLEITPYTNPCSCLHETGSKNKLGPVSLISGAGPTRMSSDRFELGPVRNFLHENTKSFQINHW